jgi:hypothetical protein
MSDKRYHPPLLSLEESDSYMKNTRYLSLTAILPFLFASLNLTADSGLLHQSAQSRPISMGTSGGNLNTIFFCGRSGYCSSGTLGGVLTDRDGDLYILSNNHVFSTDINDGLGDLVTQPGLIDAGCNLTDSDAVGMVVAQVTIGFKLNSNNRVDAALALAFDGQVHPMGHTIDLGTPSGALVENPADILGSPVVKSGRTSGYTAGTVAAVDVTIQVCYDQCPSVLCKKVGKFVNQIRITPGDFSTGGDSGSVIYHDNGGSLETVGLLFAGGATDTFANPIKEVICQLNQESGLELAPAGSGTSVFINCGGDNPDTGGGGNGNGKGNRPRNGQGLSNASVRAASAAKRVLEANLLQLQDVIGTGVGLGANGTAVIEVYLRQDTPAARNGIPQRIQGIPVHVVDIGPVHAY